MPKNGDVELGAIQNVIAALEPLEPDARSRVLEYVFKRLKIAFRQTDADVGTKVFRDVGLPVESLSSQTSTSPSHKDIRSLKEEKQPKSANQMAALVAYYLAELAPLGERKDAVSIMDITRYFKQAGFPLPKKPRVTLANATNAGYFDSSGVSGLYKLNPVGYNLVVHGLPAKGGGRATSRRPKKSGRNKGKPGI